MSRWKAKKRRKSNRHNVRAPIVGEALEIDPDPRFKATISTVPAEDFDVLTDYIEAHYLLPPDWWYTPGDPRHRQLVDQAIDIVNRSTGPDERTRAALMLLGHSPDVRVIETLQIMAARLHPLAGFARMALDECLTWAADEALLPRNPRAVAVN